MNKIERRLPHVLLFIRLSIALVMAIWVADKFVNWPHTAKVFEYFYGISGLGEMAAYALGSLQALLVLAFVTGWQKRISYGLILLIHAVSTITPIREYLQPWPNNLLFFAAWPMLAACYALYVLRDADTMLVLDKSRSGD